jgi:hypothetical protein
MFVRIYIIIVIFVSPCAAWWCTFFFFCVDMGISEPVPMNTKCRISTREEHIVLLSLYVSGCTLPRNFNFFLA